MPSSLVLMQALSIPALILEKHCANLTSYCSLTAVPTQSRPLAISLSNFFNSDLLFSQSKINNTPNKPCGSLGWASSHASAVAGAGWGGKGVTALLVASHCPVFCLHLCVLCVGECVVCTAGV